MTPPNHLTPFKVVQGNGPVAAPVASPPAASTAIQKALEIAAKHGTTPPVLFAPDTPPAPAAAAEPAAPAAVPRATAAPFPEPDSRPASYSSPGAGARTIALILKFSVSGAILLGGAYFVMHTIIPVVKELAHPGGTAALHDKNAPVFVKAIQETRLVVAKNDANVAYLNSLVGAGPNEGPGASPGALVPSTPAGPGRKTPGDLLDDPPATPSTPKPVPKPVPVTTYAPSNPALVEARGAPASMTALDLAPFNDAISDLKIGGVVGGRSPRILIDGLLVKTGDIADYHLKLRFTGVDAIRHVIFFTNDSHVVFERHY